MLGAVMVREVIALSPGARSTVGGFVLLVHIVGSVVLMVKRVGGNDGASLFRI